METEHWKTLRRDVYFDRILKDLIGVGKCDSVRCDGTCESTFSRLPSGYRWLKEKWDAVKFIEKLLENKIPIDQVNISDWESAPVIVYVSSRRYAWFGKGAWERALQTYKKYE